MSFRFSDYIATGVILIIMFTIVVIAATYVSIEADRMVNNPYTLCEQHNETYIKEYSPHVVVCGVIENGIVTNEIKRYNKK